MESPRKNLGGDPCVAAAARRWRVAAMTAVTNEYFLTLASVRGSLSTSACTKIQKETVIFRRRKAAEFYCDDDGQKSYSHTAARHNACE